MSDRPENAPPPDRDNCRMAMLCHLLSLAGLGLLFGHFIGPPAVWLLHRYDHPLIDDQGKAALNFQIAYTLYLMGLILLAFSVLNDPDRRLWIALGIGFFILLSTVHLIMVVIATEQANKGKYYRYPLTVRLIR